VTGLHVESNRAPEYLRTTNRHRFVIRTADSLARLSDDEQRLGESDQRSTR
jgi:hypothetical protein